MVSTGLTASVGESVGRENKQVKRTTWMEGMMGRDGDGGREGSRKRFPFLLASPAGEMCTESRSMRSSHWSRGGGRAPYHLYTGEGQ